MDKLTFKSFLQAEQSSFVIIDVRTPKEFAQGHIPNAINIPLFSDEERAEVGTIYKQVDPKVAFDRGLELVGPKMASLVQEARKYSDKKLLVYCWRGGMRSHSVVWLFQMAALDTTQLESGYKGYRRFIREEFTVKSNIQILGGKTGTGKTRILKVLQDLGEQMIDLEGIANHMGSSFGYRLVNIQPTNEQFENNCFDVWKNFDLNKTIWVESESSNIGNVHVVEPLYEQMLKATVLKVNASTDRRVNHILEDYENIPKETLIRSTTFIKRRLGDDRYNIIIEYLENNNYKDAVIILLGYYDKLYDHYAQKYPRETTHVFWENETIEEYAKKLIGHLKS